MKILKTNQSGLTLLELLLWMTLSVILLAAIGNYFASTVQGWLYSSNKYEVRQAASLLTNQLVSNLRFGHGYSLPANDTQTNASAGQVIQFSAPPLYSKDQAEVIQKIYLDPATKQLLLLIPNSTDPNNPKQLVQLSENIEIQVTNDLFKLHPDSNSVEIHFTIFNKKTKESLPIVTWVTSMKSTFE